ncbi:hypothetical protein EJ04DRAFT_486795 [Polyplosphaeria fusca]|uniref:Uncharacterized protein n=1 Tax=Polyplosphaeria fusca TaxID=682080 RepID=A0A9P4R6Y0_9PLEO|nr:hypothetical protein EJ04DRAFT_486795 [Polyplosphaeria fusca]
MEKLATMDDEARLQYLTTGTRDHEDLERDIGRQADQLLTEQADARDKKRIEKTEAEVKRIEQSIRKLRSRLVAPAHEVVKVKIRQQIKDHQDKIESLDEEMDTIQQRINDRHATPAEEEMQIDGTHGPRPNESRRDFLIRTGKITPFSKLAQATLGESSLADALADAEAEAEVEEEPNDSGPISHQHLKKPGFQIDISSSEAPSSPEASRPNKKRRILRGTENSSDEQDTKAVNLEITHERKTARLAAYNSESQGSESDYTQASGLQSDDSEEEEEFVGRKRKAPEKGRSKGSKPGGDFHDTGLENLAGVDDGKEKVYQDRLRTWSSNRASARKHAQERDGIEIDYRDDPEYFQQHPTVPDALLDNGLRIPGDIYPALFGYQKTGVKWLSELYSQDVGGIVADEMGLGKTIQAIAFIAGLHYSKKLTRPIIVVCPGTVMKQWVNEFHTWWPALRVVILHSSGTGMLDTRREDRMERELESTRYNRSTDTLTRAGRAAKRVVDRVKQSGHVLITTYSGLDVYREFILPTEWQCAVLDEGHKIRNPMARVTLDCKELKTSHRIILSGTPMQNKLEELWSLFDFVFPMRLGNLVEFKNQFDIPIKRGGYANASNLEFETARRTAQTLKEAISPYLLQRNKVDVAADLPKKTEKVLFCRLTRQQREAYELFLRSGDMQSIESGDKNMLFGVDYLRKICNHPDLLEHKTSSQRPNYGASNLSGKTEVVKDLLKAFKAGGHKTLLFASQKIMLDILEKMMKKLGSYNYLRMDGDTPTARRQDLVDQFNNDPDMHVFLLTTTVGGLGVNLTGADRVILYDPHWNPANDQQARERSWRLGQTRPVEIFRLMSAGTIEEKIYHRQIFKLHLAEKVLKDPTKTQTFAMNELHDLFSLGGVGDEDQTETSRLFKGAEVADATTAKKLADIKGIDHTEMYKPSNDESEEEKGDADARLMSTIFSKAGVHSVLDNDVIMGTTAGGRTRKIHADPAWIKREAQRQATEAADSLRKSEAAARMAQSGARGIATWNGEAGEGGRPTGFHSSPNPSRPSSAASMHGAHARGGRGGPSSLSVLSNLSVRQGRARPSAPDAAAIMASSPFTRAHRLLEGIISFMNQHGGTVPRQMLVQHFNIYCRTHNWTTEEFRAMLESVATLGNNGRWTLMEEWMRTVAGASRIATGASGRGGRGRR